MTTGGRHAMGGQQSATGGLLLGTRGLRGGPPASEVIGELYVPPERLADLAAAMADDSREHVVDVVHGTIRSVERSAGSSTSPSTAAAAPS